MSHLQCEHCGAPFEAPPSARRRFCSAACGNARRVGSGEPVGDRLARRLGVPDERGCRLWTGGRDTGGYGVIGVAGGRSERVHRVAWEVANGRTLRPGECVLHRCDVPLCAEPSHLWLGTRTDNNADKVAKGRLVVTPRPGSTNGQARLTEAQVVELRTRYANGEASREELAAAYGVAVTNVSMITSGKTWRHAGGPIVNGRYIGWRYHRRV